MKDISYVALLAAFLLTVFGNAAIMISFLADPAYLSKEYFKSCYNKTYVL